jgi:hypothetical protein
VAAVFERIGDALPLSVCFCGAFLSKDGLDHGDHGRALLGRDMGQSVAHPVYTAALKRGMEDLRGGRRTAPRSDFIALDHYRAGMRS